MPTPVPCSALRACGRSAPPKARAPREQGGVLCWNVFAGLGAAKTSYVQREGCPCFRSLWRTAPGLPGALARSDKE